MNIIFFDYKENAVFFLDLYVDILYKYYKPKETIDLSNNFFADKSCYAENPLCYRDYKHRLPNALFDEVKSLIQCDKIIWDNVCPKTGEKSHVVYGNTLALCKPDNKEGYKPYLLASILGCVDCMRKYKNTDVHALGENYMNAYDLAPNVECMAQARNDGVDVHSTIARKEMLSGYASTFSNAYMKACIHGDLERMKQAFDDGINVRYCDNTTSDIDGLALAESSKNKLAVELAKKHLKLTEEKEE